MYLKFYGLKMAPFDLTPNPRFLFHSAKHREAINHLLYGIRERKGFVQLTGEVGAGKTTLCRALMEQLDSHFSTALLLTPVLDAQELVKSIAAEFGLETKGLDRLETMAVINDFLIKQIIKGRDCVLIIDEAQNFSDDLLEQVRQLSNIETDDRKLLQIILIGQPELRALVLGRHIIGVAFEAERRVFGIGQAEVLGDAFRAVGSQRDIGLGVLILLRPDEILVLRNMRVGQRPNRAVAIIAGAALNAEMGDGALGLRQRRRREDEDEEGGADQRA